MTRRLVVWISLVTLTAGMVLNTSMRTHSQEDRLAEVNRSIEAERERIRVLTAEWHSLNTPERIEALTRRHLPALGRIEPEQMASLTDIPERLPEAASPPPVLQAQVKPVVRPQTKPAGKPQDQDEVAKLIGRTGNVSTVHEQKPAAPGLLWASLDGLEE